MVDEKQIDIFRVCFENFQWALLLPSYNLIPGLCFNSKLMFLDSKFN